MAGLKLQQFSSKWGKYKIGIQLITRKLYNHNIQELPLY
jgi:hypothetical protein